MSDKISVRDFKSMIEGMDTVLGDDWVPTAEQWKKIRERIRQLDDTAPIATPTPPAEYVQPVRVVSKPAEPAQSARIDPSEEALLRAFPQVPASVPANIPVTVKPGQSAFAPQTAALIPQRPVPIPQTPPLNPTALANLPPAARAAALKAAAVKTPDIDSTKGYNSSYV